MTNAAELVAEVERLGGTLRLDGNDVKVRVPKDRRAECAPLLAQLREMRPAVADLVRNRQMAAGKGFVWPQQSLDCERMFGHPSTRLYPFIGSLVVTPKGTGELIQVFTNRAGVVLDAELTKPTGERRMTFFSPAEVLPRQLV